VYLTISGTNLPVYTVFNSEDQNLKVTGAHANKGHSLASVAKTLDKPYGLLRSPQELIQKGRLFILPSERVAKTHFTKKEKCIKNTISPIIHALSRGSVADT
jgi:hypothetical protein